MNAKLLILALLILVPISRAVACGTIVADTTMDTDLIYNAATCFTFGANGITLDCADHVIGGKLTIGTFAIITSNYNYTTIKNCRIINYSNAIAANYTNHTRIINVTHSNATGANGLDGASGLRCGAGAQGDSAYSILMQYGRNITVQDYLAYNLTAGNGGNGGSTTSGTGAAGCAGGQGGMAYMFSCLSNNVTLINVTIKDVRSGGGGLGGNGYLAFNGGKGGDSGIALAYWSYYMQNATISNFTVVNFTVGAAGTGGLCGATGAHGGDGGVGQWVAGIWTYQSYYTEIGNFSYFQNMTGGRGGDGGACASGTGGNGSMGGSAIGIYFNGCAYWNKSISDTNVTGIQGGRGGNGGTGGASGNGSSGNIAHGIYIYQCGTVMSGNITNVLISNITGGVMGTGASNGRTENGTGIIITTNSYFVNLTNVKINETSGYDLTLGVAAQNVYSFNSTFNLNKINWLTCAPCNLTLVWWVRVNVTTSAGQALAASVNASDMNGTSRFSGTAGADGNTSWFMVVGMIMNKSGTAYENYTLNNHTVNASYAGYTLNQSSFNFTNTGTWNITLYIEGAVSDYSFTITYPIGTKFIAFEPPYHNYTGLNASNQTDTIAILEFVNTGSVSEIYKVNLSAGAPAGITPYCAATFNAGASLSGNCNCSGSQGSPMCLASVYSACCNLTTAQAQINGTVTPVSGKQTLWCWADFIAVAAGTTESKMEAESS